MTMIIIKPDYSFQHIMKSNSKEFTQEQRDKLVELENRRKSSIHEDKL